MGGGRRSVGRLGRVVEKGPVAGFAQVYRSPASAVPPPWKLVCSAIQIHRPSAGEHSSRLAGHEMTYQRDTSVLMARNACNGLRAICFLGVRWLID